MRVRLRFTKHGKVRFTSHRDVARIWERVLRRADVPVAATEGFSPRPKVHFGLALPTGYESEGEYLDVDLREPEGDDVAVDELPALLTPLLPPGIAVVAAAVTDRRATSLQQAVTTCRWEIDVEGLGGDAVDVAITDLLARTEVVVTRVRKGKEVVDDIRPAIRCLERLGPVPDDRPGPGTVVAAELATQPRSVRPTELLGALAPGASEGFVRRTHQWIESDGARSEPLPLATRHAPAPAGAT